MEAVMKRFLLNRSVFLIVFSFFLFSCASKNHEGPLVNSANEENKAIPAITPSEAGKSQPAKFVYKPPVFTDLVPRGLDFANAPEVIAFGSSANQDASQPIWDVIAKNNPDLFIFSGNNVYASTKEAKPISLQYKKLNQIKEFRSFREKIPFLVAWDDHDYGMNDGGADNPEKEEAKKDFLNQWPYVKDSLKLGQAGIYHAKILGGVKKKSPTVQVVLLDTRWFRSPLKLANDPTNPQRKYLPNEDKGATLLGEEQWRWLERQMLKPANVRIIVSSIQFVAEAHGFEKWGLFPKEKDRFIQLLKRTNAKNVFMISGDRERGSIAKMDIKGWGPLFDITASSINKPTDLEEEDPSYIGPQIKKENFGLALIDWHRKRIRFEIRDIGNNVVNKIETSLK